MKSLNRRIEKVKNSKNILISTRIQLDLLARLLSKDSTHISSEFWEDADVFNELEDILYLVHLVTNKVDTLYKCVSTELQLPNHEFNCHSNSLKS